MCIHYRGCYMDNSELCASVIHMYQNKAEFIYFIYYRFFQIFLMLLYYFKRHDNITIYIYTQILHMK